MNILGNSKSRPVIALAGALLLAGCASGGVEEAKRGQPTLDDLNLTELLDQAQQSPRLGDQFIRSGLEALQENDYITAQAGFNRALKFDPTNSHLHFLNGLTYHLRTAAGDSSQKDFAAIGYRLALQYDSSNYWAAYQLGHLNFNDQRFREAQDAFAYGLLFAPEEPALLKALAVSSYYAQDLETAASAIKRASKLVPDDTGFLRIAAMVNAAANKTDDARLYLSKYEKSGGRLANRLQSRISDWRNFHSRRDGIQLAQSASEILGGGGSSSGNTDNANSDSSSDNSSTSNASSAAPAAKGKRMAMVDVVIIRSEERRITNKGVNLLSGLALTLPTGTNTFNFTSTRTANDPGTGANTLVNTFAYSAPLQVSASYSLNIFNDNNDKNEVLARPSLVALDGEQSEFFTGAVFHVQLTGTAGSEGTVTDVSVGIKLQVTPKFLDDDLLEIGVTASRAFIEDRSSQINFSNFAQTTKNNVTANVSMRFGDTLVISGLSEKETERLNDGVPFLQDIPGLQYLFSHEDTLDFTKSVLILLTPRQPKFVHEDGSPRVDRENPQDAEKKQPSLDELKSRPDWFKPASNLDAVFHHLKDRRLFKEFRTGDVRLENWADDFSLGVRIRRAIEFLYF